MQILRKIGRIAAAGSIAALMTGSSIAFAQLEKFPEPFVSTGQANTLIVVGATAAPSDVVGAIDIAARLGGETSTTVTVSGAQVPVSISGEGKEISTKTTQIFLQDTLGKTGLRNTLTSDDMPVTLATGSLVDVDRGTTHKYRQFIDLTPAGTTANYRIDYDKPSTSSSADPIYNLGRFTTAPSATEYLYKTRVVFDTGVNGSTSVGEKLTLFGKDYTISSGTTGFAGTSSDKLVLFGGAVSQVLQGGQKITTTVGGKSYDVTLVGASSATVAVIKVGTDQRSVTKGASTVTIGGLDVYVDDVFLINANDQTQNSAKVLLGAEQVTLQEGSKLKTGKDELSVDGTFVDLSASSGLLTQIAVTIGGASSTNDFLSVGGKYTDPAWKTFSVAFPSLSGGLKDGNLWEVRNSGDNLLQVTGKDDKNQPISLNWAYKGTSSATALSLADSNGDAIHVVENETLSRDHYLVLDAGGFPHIYEVTAVALDGTTSASIDLRDVVSGTTTKITAGTDNQETAVIDGQNYHFVNDSSTSFRVTWGAGSGVNSVGDFVTVLPAIKGKNGEWVAFSGASNTVPVLDGKKYQFPTGAFTLTLAGGVASFAAAAKEDGTTSVVSSTGTLNTTVSGTSAIVTVGRTATGAVKYNLTAVSATSMTVRVVGSGSTTLTQPSIIVVEEKDSDGNQAAVVIPASTEVSGSNNLAIVGSPDFTSGTKSGAQTLGSNSNIDSQVDIWGTYSVRDTTSQDTLKVYYPDDQVTANVVVLKSDSTVSTGGSTAATTLKTAVPIKTALGKLDTEVTTADKTAMNLILVGGPVVNTLVAELAAAGKTRDTQFFRDNGAGTSIIDLVSDAFTAGKSALVVAGYEAGETREAAKWVQTFDVDPAKSAFMGRSRVVIKGGVLSTTAV